jgi:hypothetical protein
MTRHSTGPTGGRPDWGSDFFGTLNEMPPEPVIGISHVLDAMSTLPAFRDARLWVLRNWVDILSIGNRIEQVGEAGDQRRLTQRQSLIMICPVD